MPHSTQTTETLNGTTAPQGHVAPADMPDCYPKGRVCDEIGCGTVLTIWNPGPYCFCCAERRERDIIRAASRLDGQRVTLAERQERNAGIRALVADGWLLHEVATLYGLAPTTMSKIVGEAGQTAADEAVAA